MKNDIYSQRCRQYIKSQNRSNDAPEEHFYLFIVLIIYFLFHSHDFKVCACTLYSRCCRYDSFEWREYVACRSISSSSKKAPYHSSQNKNVHQFSVLTTRHPLTIYHEYIMLAWKWMLAPHNQITFHNFYISCQHYTKWPHV